MRPISDNVFKEFTKSYYQMHKGEGKCENIINAYLTECWQVFDKDDEKTWPELDKYVIISTCDGEWDFDYLTKVTYEGGEDSPVFWNSNSGSDIDFITHYLDPADIMPSFAKGGM